MLVIHPSLFTCTHPLIRLHPQSSTITHIHPPSPILIPPHPHSCPITHTRSPLPSFILPHPYSFPHHPHSSIFIHHYPHSFPLTPTHSPSPTVVPPYSHSSSTIHTHPSSSPPHTGLLDLAKLRRDKIQVGTEHRSGNELHPERPLERPRAPGEGGGGDGTLRIPGLAEQGREDSGA